MNNIKAYSLSYLLLKDIVQNISKTIIHSNFKSIHNKQHNRYTHAKVHKFIGIHKDFTMCTDLIWKHATAPAPILPNRYQYGLKLLDYAFQE